MENTPTTSPKRRPPADLLPNEQEISYEGLHGFFNRYKSLIVLGCVAAILGAIGWIAWRAQEDKVRQRAYEQLSQAKSVESLQAIVREFLGTEAGLIADLSLGDIFFQQGQYEQAVGCYQSVLNHYPSSPLVPSALIGLAAVAEASGKIPDAVKAYQSIAASYPSSFQAAQAQFAAARLLESSGQLTEARQAYEDVMTRHPSSAWSLEARDRLQKVNLLAPSRAPSPSGS